MFRYVTLSVFLCTTSVAVRAAILELDNTSFLTLILMWD